MSSRPKPPAATASKKQLGAAETSIPPAPFSKAPEKYTPFLKELDETKVYIIHLDTTPRAFKQKIFAAPVVLNLVITLLLCWRWYAIFPHYMDLVLLVLGHDTGAAGVTIDGAAARTRGQMIWFVLRRTMMLLFDFVLVRFVAGWPLTFFLQAPANPALWRWKVGFADTEIVVRVSRGWGRDDLVSGLNQGHDSPFFKTRILPAIDKRFMQGKTGYLMIRKDWDLDFYAMVHATGLVKGKKLVFEDFQKTVLAHSETHGWMSWFVHELDEGSEEEARKKIVAFKDRLTAMGKENLFFRWVEIIQYESSQPEGFTRERQEAAVDKAKALFEQQGVDFEEFARSLGGPDTFPGMA